VIIEQRDYPLKPVTADTVPPKAAQEYIDAMARDRGYVLDYHKVMAQHDFDVLQATNGLVEAAYLRPRALDRRTKELLFICVSLACA
jgi:4-carboxymuconolactone decarboxylase